MREHDGDITPGMNSYYGEINLSATPPTKYRKWGMCGTRYDEPCAKCRRVSKIDNDTELCRRCGK